MDYFQKALARQQLGEFYFCQNQMTVLYRCMHPQHMLFKHMVAKQYVAELTTKPDFYSVL